MPPSPEVGSSALVSVTVLADGQALADAIQVISVSVTKAVNRIASAQIVLLDGDMPQGDFPISSSSTLLPGAEIEIKAGYDDQTATIFKGVVVRHSIRITGQNDATLTVDCQDKAMKMTLGRRNANYTDQKDSDILSALIGAHGLTATVDATEVEHKALAQYLSTDWDFMLTRAEANGLIVLVSDGAVTVRKPVADGAQPVLLVTYGTDIVELHAEIDARTQYAAVKGACWDGDARTITTSTSQPVAVTSQGNLTTATLAGVGALSEFRLQSSAPLNRSALQKWADAQQVKSGLARVRGRVKFAGNSTVTPASLITIAGIGGRFNGDAFVGAVRHEIANGDWGTEVELGVDPDWFAERRDIARPPAAGLLPPVHGLHVGVVSKLDEDPEGLYRIQVSLPLLEATTATVWARLMQYYASNQFGAYFLPEIGDEVVIGYIDSDPTYPVILGSVYSKNRQPPYTPDAPNNTKAIVTRTKMKIEFNEEKKIITITTPANNKAVLDDDDKSILLSDQNGNTVKMSTTGIALDSPKDITINAKGKVSIDAVQNVTINSSAADAVVTALNVSHEAKIAFTGKGTATAELSAAGQTTVKGALVMIN